MPAFMEDLKTKIYQKIKVKPVPSSAGAVTTHMYITKFMDELRGLVNTVFVDAGGLFFDSVELRATGKGSTASKLYATGGIDNSCLLAAVGLNYADPFADYDQSAKCTPKSYQARMQVQENYVQDVFVASDEEWAVNKSMKMYDGYKISSFNKVSKDGNVGMEPMGEVIGTGYNTLWSCMFTLDPVKKVNTETWLVQDQDAPRRSIKYLMELKDQFMKRPSIISDMDKEWFNATIVKSTDFIGFIGGLVFLLSSLSQLFVRKVN